MRVVLMPASEVQRRGVFDGPWIYLGQDYDLYSEWLDELGPPLTDGDLLQRVVEDLRKPFLASLASLPGPDPDLSWWVSRLSERNPSVSPLFIECCYLEMARRLLADERSDMLVVAESHPLIEAVEQLARAKGHHVKRHGRWRGRMAGLREGVRGVLSLGYFLARGMYRWAHARNLPVPGPTEPGRPGALLRTWVDESCLRPDGLNDRYFRNLDSWLTDRGFDVSTVLVFSGIKRPWRKVVEWARAAPQRLVIAEALLRPWDLGWVAAASLRPRPWARAQLTLGELPVAPLFRSELRRSRLSTGTLEALAWYRVPLRLAQVGVVPNLVVDPFENHVAEKGLVLGLRRWQPGARINGYLHYPVSPAHLNNFPAPGELATAPFPDTIVVNGPLFHRILEAEGFAADRLRIGPALRHAHLLSPPRDSSPKAHDLPVVLVVLPLHPGPGREVIAKLGAALADAPYRVVVKPHGMMRSDILASVLGELPDNFSRDDRPLPELLPQADVLAVPPSSAAFDGLAAGVPVVLVGSDIQLEYNPLAWIEDGPKIHRGIATLRSEIDLLLSMTREERNRLVEQGQAAVRQAFGPIDETSMKAFLP